VNSYPIPRLTQNTRIDALWHKMPWSGITALQIDQINGERPAHLPHTAAKLAYNTESLYLIFQVEDRYVRALAENYQDRVCEDSCVEFFFTPGEDPAQGYFNLEVNCGGTALFNHQKGRNIEKQPVSTADFEEVQIAHTLPKKVDPEITTALTWAVEYRLPFAVLENYTQFNAPAWGTRWLANLYKCADGCSHPHWLTWSHVDTRTPDFHRPEFFGHLIFE